MNCYLKCKDGVIRNNFIATVSKTAAKGFRDKIKALEIHKKIGCKIDMIAELLNPMLRGWMNYFGKFNPSAMKNTLQCIEHSLIKWAMCKYKSFRGRRQRAEKWLSSIRKREPKLFAYLTYSTERTAANHRLLFDYSLWGIREPAPFPAFWLRTAARPLF